MQRGPVTDLQHENRRRAIEVMYSTGVSITREIRVNLLRPAAIALLILPTAGPVHAALINVVNPSFEDTSGSTTLFNEFSFGPLSGWELYDPGTITGGGAGPTYFIGTIDPAEPAFFTAGAPDGQRVGIAFNFFGSGDGGEYGMRQVLGEGLQPNTTYTLEVEIGNIASGTAQDGTFFNIDGFPGYRVDLLAGGVIVAQDVNSLAGTIPEGEFGTSTVSLTTDNNPVAGLLEIRLVNLNQVDMTNANTTAADLEVDFDNVRLDASPAAVPEPGGFLIAGLAVVLSIARRRRSRTSQQGC